MQPNERFTLVGKTRSGKSTLAAVMMMMLVTEAMIRISGWRVWVFDTKGDPRDLARLRKMGFVEGDPATGQPLRKPRRFSNEPEPGRLFFRLRAHDGLTIYDQAQHLCALAMKRHRVLIVIDEYTTVIKSKVDAGPDLLDVHTRGGGLGVGLIGCTQEPTYIPRQLASQATHFGLLDLSHPPDIKWARDFCPAYDRPQNIAKAAGRDPTRETHGFFMTWLDGDGEWRYYPDLRAWRSLVVEGTTNGTGPHRTQGR